jgi:hypothetical protein
LIAGGVLILIIMGETALSTIPHAAGALLIFAFGLAILSGLAFIPGGLHLIRHGTIHRAYMYAAFGLLIAWPIINMTH